MGDASDLSDLPPEVLAELRGKVRMDSLEAMILAIVADVGGGVGLDLVIIELWRRHKILETRRFLMSKLYRMSLAGRLHRVPRAKATYRLPSPTPAP